METLQQSAGSSRTCAKCGQKVAGNLDRCPNDGAPLLSAEAIARVGTRVGNYELKGVIGEGGTGVVYRGRHRANDSQVAIKILHDHCVRRKDVLEQVLADAGAASRIHHANVVEVIDVGATPEGAVFLVTELLVGESLADRLRRTGRPPIFEALNILRQAAHGLGAAHEAGLIHGGLKPSNIFLCKREGRRRIVRRSKAKGMRLVVEPEESFDLVKLLDFGMARFLDIAPSAEAPTCAVCGTLHYLSPEQVQGRPADLHSDIYSLGAVFYEIVTGAVPFGGESLADVLRGHVSGEVIAPSRRTPSAGIDARIDGLILKCLKKKPSLRFASTYELCEALDACVTDCAFLRDAHRLPGIVDSGIDLSEAMPKAKQEPAPAPVAEKTAAAPVLTMPAPAPVVEKPAAAPVLTMPAPAPPAEKPAAAPVLAMPAPAPVVEKPAAAPVPTKPAPAPVVEKPATAPLFATLAPAPVVEKPAAAPLPAMPAPAPVVEKPAAAPVPAKPVPAPVVEKPAAAPVPAEPAPAPTVDDPAAAMVTPPPALAPTADDPAAAVITPPPVVVAGAVDPAATVITPPPEMVTAKAHTEMPATPAHEPTPSPREQPTAMAADPMQRLNRLDLDDDLPPSKRRATTSTRPQLTALAAVLLLGGAGVALWSTRSDWLPLVVTQPAVVAPALPAAAPTPTPTPPAENPTAVPVAPAPAAPTPTATPPAETPTAVPIAPAPAAPAPSPASPPPAPAPAPAAEEVAPLPTAPPVGTPKSERAVRAGHAAHAPLAKTKIGKVRARPAPAAGARPKRPVLADPFAPDAETAPEPAAKPKPQPEAEPPAPSKAAAEPELVPPPAPPPPPSAGDLVREAQQAWIRGHYGLAIGKAEAALEAEPKPAQAMQAYEIIATCSCALHKAAAAREAASHLSDSRREMVKTVCEKHGVTIE
jgi:eukaryotic-like serine/threonine-protein kinase